MDGASCTKAFENKITFVSRSGSRFWGSERPELVVAGRKKQNGEVNLVCVDFAKVRIRRTWFDPISVENVPAAQLIRKH